MKKKLKKTKQENFEMLTLEHLSKIIGGGDGTGDNGDGDEDEQGGMFSQQ